MKDNCTYSEGHPHLLVEERPEEGQGQEEEENASEPPHVLHHVVAMGQPSVVQPVGHFGGLASNGLHLPLHPQLQGEKQSV